MHSVRVKPAATHVHSSVASKSPQDNIYWKSYFDSIATKFHVIHLDDWYKVKENDIRAISDDFILKPFGNSLYKALSTVYPDHQWVPWKFQLVPYGHWGDHENHKQYFEWLGSQIGIKQMDDWYSVQTSKLPASYGIRRVIKAHQSLFHALSSVYPDYQWIPWKFEKVPKGCWQDTSNHQAYFDWLASQIGITQMEDWYKVTIADIKKHGGISLLNDYYNTSVCEALKHIYPEYNWLPWKFDITPHGYWSDIDNQRKFWNWFANEKGIKKEEDWYSITLEQVAPYAKGLLALYKKSLFAALQAAFPDIQFMGWKFTSPPKHYWSDGANRNRCITYLTEQLHINQLNDWYRVSGDQIQQLGGASLIKWYGGMANFLQAVYPNHAWDPQKLSSTLQNGTKRSSQRWLTITIRQMFPDLQVIEEYSNEQLKFRHTGREMQLDVYIPQLSLALEYQGKHHYEDVFYFAPRQQYKERDDMKRKVCLEKGITLIDIPYWWDKKASSVAHAICSVRPDIAQSYPSVANLSKQGQPIPDRPPKTRRKQRV